MPLRPYIRNWTFDDISSALFHSDFLCDPSLVVDDDRPGANWSTWYRTVMFTITDHMHKL